MTRVKVCGVTRETDLKAAVEAGADAVGVISQVSVETPREVDEDRAGELVAAAPPFVATVLVTMARTTGRITELAEEIRPDAVQIHADLTPPRVAGLANDLDAAVIKVIDADEPDLAARYDGVADALVVDSLSPEGAGGTGETHDWERTRSAVADLESPVVLAGGLTPENVGAAVRTVDPFAVDVASGVERDGGVKDHEAVRSFVANATAARRRSVEESVGDVESGVES
jgi:phosphoribosylanthranilate isomerase